MYIYLTQQYMLRRFLQIELCKLPLLTLYFRNTHDTNKNKLSKRSFPVKKQRLSFPSTGRNIQNLAELHHLTKMYQHWTYGMVQAMLSDFWTGSLTNTHNLLNYSQLLICQLMVFIGNRNCKNKKQQHGRELIYNM